MAAQQIAVFGSTFSVDDTGHVHVRIDGKWKTYNRRKLPALESIEDMQKRIEEDIVDRQRQQARAVRLVLLPDDSH